MKATCEMIDRLISTETRSPHLPRGIIPSLYESARGNGDPIVYLAAQAFKEEINSKNKPKFGLITGVWHP